MSGLDSGEETDGTVERPASVAEKLVLEANAFIALLRKPPDDEGLDDLPDNLRQMLQEAPPGNVCWNSLKEVEKQDLMQETDVDAESQDNARVQDICDFEFRC
jgi:hypothetical protein